MNNYKIKNSQIKLLECLLLGFLVILGMPIIVETQSIQLNNNSYPINISANPVNYTITPGHPYTWIDASSGIELILGDDDSASTTLPFNFTFYDDNYSEIHITTEGYITFLLKPVKKNGIIPSSHPHHQKIIAPYWNNLDGVSGRIYVKNFSSYWVAAWENFNHDNNSFAGTFETILYDNGDIVFNYDILTNVSSYACGLNYGDGNNYSSYNQLTSSINDFSIKFSLNGGNGGNGGNGRNGGNGGNGGADGLTSNVINTIVISVVAVAVISAAGGITLYFYKRNPGQFKAKLSQSKTRVREGASKLKKKLKEGSAKLKEKVSKDKNGITTKSPKEE